MSVRLRVMATSVALLLWACASDPTPTVESEVEDAAIDGAVADATSPDATSPDATSPDATPADAAVDAGQSPGCNEVCDGTNEDGRPLGCRDQRCEPLLVCCIDARPHDHCTLAFEDACAGDLIFGVLGCAHDPCYGLTCPGNCPEGRYCDLEADACLEACRAEDCVAPSEFCLPDSSGCSEIRCDSLEDCPDGAYCDWRGPDATDLCVRGCGLDDDCPEGEVCVGGLCGDFESD